MTPDTPLLADPSDLADLLDPLLDHRHKGYPGGAPALRRSRVGAQGWSVLAGDLPLPLALIKRDALAHNLGWMQRFCQAQGVGLAPHGKTTMSPQLFQRQLQAGAWGMTVATVAQLGIAVAAGARRALIANQVLQATDLAAIAALCGRHPGLQVVFLLDSLAQLALIEATAPAHPFEVLLELGLPGGRTGCRHHDQALALARAARASSAVRLVGVECYEGALASGDSALDTAATQALMDRVHALALQCEAEGLFEAEQLILSAGGSAIFDLVLPGLRAPLAHAVQPLLRSGCYAAHDDGFYQRLVSVVNQRLGCAQANGLQAALEVWALVQAVPEPGLAILAVGKRDISYDLDLPQPRALWPAGATQAQAVPDGWRITGLNDQHAYLHTGAASPAVGDRVVLGISHPCTTFDKWRWLPVVDDHYRVVDAVTTCF
ncbi:MAG: amino acid deaminase [Burkholderiales bacterium PBB5]|nr:MAG: amino acid deaminase [Burkholderiales bacterium PBB5]